MTFVQAIEELVSILAQNCAESYVLGALTADGRVCAIFAQTQAGAWGDVCDYVAYALKMSRVFKAQSEASAVHAIHRLCATIAHSADENSTALAGALLQTLDDRYN